MPIDPKQLEKFRAHLKECGITAMACPVCGQKAWRVYPPIATPKYSEDVFGRAVGSESMPVIPVVCNTCFYVRHFAWEPIAKKKPDGGR